MKRIALGWLAVTALLAATGCNTLSRQPRMLEPKIVKPDVLVTDASGDLKPDESGVLKPGESGVITVKVLDRHHIVARVVGYVEEDPRFKFKLSDDGATPDKKAQDGVWTLQVDVPFMAPPGDYTLQLTGYRSNGEPVMVRTKEGDVVPLQARFVFTVVYPEGEAPPQQ